MNIYEIDAQIAALLELDEEEIIDEETGEVIPVAQALDELAMARETKIENVACMVKDLVALSKAMHEEAARLEDRSKAAQRKADNLKQYLLGALTQPDGAVDKFHSVRADISTRRVESVTITDEKQLPAAYIEVRTTSAPKKKEIREAIKAGAFVPGAELTQKMAVIIK